MRRLFLFLVIATSALSAQANLPLMGVGGVAAAGGITPPTIVASVGLAAGTGTRSTASVSWQSGDIIIIGGTDEGAGTESFNTPTATGLTFSAVVTHTSASNCAMAIYKATAAGSGSSTITWSTTASTKNWNAWAFVLRGSGGVGNSASQFTSTKTVSLTPTQANSFVFWVVGDWAAVASPAATPTSPNETTLQAAQSGTAYSYVSAQISNQTSAGAVSYGYSGSSTGPFSIGVVEVKGQ